MENVLPFLQIAILAYCAIAAIIDYRTGLIPNWLTFPGIFLPPLAYLIAIGPSAAAWSVGGVFICGFIPYVMFCKDAIGGGDVKLFAAIGAIATPLLTIIVPVEAQLYSYIVASVIALSQIAWKGSIKQSFKTMGIIISNLFKKAADKIPVDTSMTHSLRLGPSIFLGTLICFAGNLF